MILKFVLPLASALAIATPLAAQWNGPDRYAPGAIMVGDDIHVVANETVAPGDVRLMYTHLVSTGWSKAEYLGRKVSGPALVYDTDGLHVFVVDSTGRLSHRARGTDGKWGAWSVVPRGSSLRGRPGAAIYNGVTYIFVIGGDLKVWYTTGSKGTYGAKWTGFGDMPTRESPSAMADGKRLMVVGVNPATGLGTYKTFTGSWGPLKGWYTDPMNQPLGQLIVAPGDQDNSVWLASMLHVPANRMMVSSPFADGNQYDGQQLDASSETAPVLFRGKGNALNIIVRSVTDKFLWYRTMRDGNVSGWIKINPPH